MQKNLTFTERLNLNSSLGLKQFELGLVIAKGNNAVVYEARKTEENKGILDFLCILVLPCINELCITNRYLLSINVSNHITIYH